MPNGEPECMNRSLAREGEGWTLGPATDADREFLYRLHCLTMREVIERTWGWDEAWQRADFERRLREYVTWVVELEGCAAGGLCVEWRSDSLYIHELQLLPEYQGRGVGTAVIEHVVEAAVAQGLPVALSVVPANARAKRLYERLGFKTTAVEPPFVRMAWDARRQLR